MYQKINERCKYPMLEVNLKKVYDNVKYMVDLCGSQGISVAGVIKGFNALPEVSEQFENAGCAYIASSRIEHLIRQKKHGIKAPLMLLRIPMLSEIDELVEYIEISLNSEIETLKIIQKECEAQNKTHKVILMYDLGDLREGIMNEEEMVDLAEYVETQLSNVELYGIGTNLGCYGSIKPTEENLGKLCDIAEMIENRINRKLDVISGGATSSLPLIIEGKMPEKINNLRIGEGILLAEDLQELWGYDMSYMHKDTFVLKAQVVEVKEKPSYPIGEIFIDAFGNKPYYEDRGMRKRALLAVGKQDFGFHDKLIPQMEGMEIVGSSSDHLIVDIENCKEQLVVGDVVEFTMYYPSLLYLSGNFDLSKRFIG